VLSTTVRILLLRGVGHNPIRIAKATLAVIEGTWRTSLPATIVRAFTPTGALRASASIRLCHPLLAGSDPDTD